MYLINSSLTEYSYLYAPAHLINKTKLLFNRVTVTSHKNLTDNETAMFIFLVDQHSTAQPPSLGGNFFNLNLLSLTLTFRDEVSGECFYKCRPP